VNQNQATPSSDVWFVYDGDCPVCSTAAQALRIRAAVGALHLVDARQQPDHALIREIGSLGLDLDEGMVLKYCGVCYHGRDALHMMALLGSRQGWFNRLTALCFRSKTVARLAYPPMRAARNLLLRLMGRSRIDNLHSGAVPIFEPILGSDWARLPPLMRERFAIRPFSDDALTLEGTLDVAVSPLMRLIARLSGTFVSRSGRAVPVTVRFRSAKHTVGVVFDRSFHFAGGEQRFVSCMEPIGGNELVEFLRFGVGWKVACRWTGQSVVFAHRGYVWRLFGILVPLPLGLLIGAGHGEETPTSEDGFTLAAYAAHPWFGTTFSYGGPFRLTRASP
jgi:predicted DCC family thiol-disulfide oxidoreductase YuxK